MSPKAADNHHAELRSRLDDLVASARELHEVLSRGEQLPAFALAKATLAIDQAAEKLAKHSAILAGRGKASAKEDTGPGLFDQEQPADGTGKRSGRRQRG